MTTKDDRAARLAAQLRANLHKRREQARAAVPLPDPDQRASAIDPSDVAAPAA